MKNGGRLADRIVGIVSRAPKDTLFSATDFLRLSSRAAVD